MRVRALALAVVVVVVPVVGPAVSARADELRPDDFPEALRPLARQIAEVWRDHPDDPSSPAIGSTSSPTRSCARWAPPGRSTR